MVETTPPGRWVTPGFFRWGEAHPPGPPCTLGRTAGRRPSHNPWLHNFSGRSRTFFANPPFVHPSRSLFLLSLVPFRSRFWVWWWGLAGVGGWVPGVLCARWVPARVGRVVGCVVVLGLWGVGNGFFVCCGYWGRDGLPTGDAGGSIQGVLYPQNMGSGCVEQVSVPPKPRMVRKRGVRSGLEVRNGKRKNGNGHPPPNPDRAESGPHQHNTPTPRWARTRPGRQSHKPGALHPKKGPKKIALLSPPSSAAPPHARGRRVRRPPHRARSHHHTPMEPPQKRAPTTPPHAASPHTPRTNPASARSHTPTPTKKGTPRPAHQHAKQGVPPPHRTNTRAGPGYKTTRPPCAKAHTRCRDQPTISPTKAWDIPRSNNFNTSCSAANDTNFPPRSKKAATSRSNAAWATTKSPGSTNIHARSKDPISHGFPHNSSNADGNQPWACNASARTANVTSASPGNNRPNTSRHRWASSPSVSTSAQAAATSGDNSSTATPSTKGLCSNTCFSIAQTLGPRTSPHQHGPTQTPMTLHP